MIAKSYLLPDTRSLEPELSLEGGWDSRAVSDLIRRKSSYDRTPACLFLGRREAALLRGHLSAAFGSNAVATLKSTYYMGLEVVEIDCDSFVYVGGRKTVRTLQDPIARRPAWRDADEEGLWRLRLA
ncbi:hypothetical protein KBB96_20565 [Luteolibacter ambystomatis]|uniref:Uncharacterized protein n=1 Tax=Luteolibacter ambystomatis TaxID=2824561 RepID=A0A975G8W2_9BACT|nr:hypothetical protein [Luteolibacter ambystomatis]QUE51234.1 hypothetical protein KBB96_20565 [Luteolibacter ambystomatis]